MMVRYVFYIWLCLRVECLSSCADADCSDSKICITNNSTTECGDRTWPYINGNDTQFCDSASAAVVQCCREDILQNYTFYNGSVTDGKVHNINGSLYRYSCTKSNAPDVSDANQCEHCSNTLSTKCNASSGDTANKGKCPAQCLCSSTCDCCPLWAATATDDAFYDGYTCCGSTMGQEYHFQQYCKSADLCDTSTSSSLSEKCFAPANGTTLVTYTSQCPDGPQFVQDMSKDPNTDDITHVCCQENSCINNYCTSHAKCSEPTSDSCVNRCADNESCDTDGTNTTGTYTECVPT